MVRSWAVLGFTVASLPGRAGTAGIVRGPGAPLALAVAACLARNAGTYRTPNR